MGCSHSRLLEGVKDKKECSLLSGPRRSGRPVPAAPNWVRLKVKENRDMPRLRSARRSLTRVPH